MKENEKSKKLKEVLKEHRPIDVDLGDGVHLYSQWDEEKKAYVDEMGIWSTNLLLEIINGEVENTSLSELKDLSKLKK